MVKRRRIDIPNVTGEIGVGAVISGDSEYTLEQKLWSTAISDVYLCAYDGKKALMKINRDVADIDLARKEVATLDLMFSREPVANPHKRYTISIEKTVNIQSPDGRRLGLLTNTNLDAESLYSIEEIHRVYPTGVHSKAAAWMFNRMLEGLHYVHASSIVHGAVLPNHILFDRRTHGGVLFEYSYAVNRQEVLPPDPNESQRISVIDDKYEDWYPPEVRNKEVVTPATDIYMVAGCVVYLLGGNPVTKEIPVTVPREFAGLLRSCLVPRPIDRPKSIDQVYEYFKDVLKTVFGAKQFIPFEMPVRASL